MVAYLKATPNEKAYSDYLCVAREGEKEEAMDTACSHTADSMGKPKVMSFFPLGKLKGNQPMKTPTVSVVHLEQDSADKQENAKSDDPSRIEGVMEEFIMHLTQAVKEAQQDEKCCYHCSSPEHFICKCPLVKASRSATHLNWKEETALEKGAWTPQVKVTKLKAPPEGMPKV